MIRIRLIAFTAGVALLVTSASAVELPLPVAELKRSEPVDFAKEIMPILKRNCVACHHQKEAEGGLNLETIDDIRKGGDSGHGVVAKDVDASSLFVRATGAEDPLMPPEDNDVGAKPLTPEELGLLKLWIEQGADGTDPTMSESIQWQPIPESIRSIYAMDVSPAGRFAVFGRGNRIAMINMDSYEESAPLFDPSLQGRVADVDLIQSIAVSPDGGRIASGGFRTVRIWKKSPIRIDPTTTPLSKAAGLVAVNTDQSVAVLVNAIGDLEVWDQKLNQKTRALTGNQNSVTGLTVAADHVIAVGEAGRLICWNWKSGKQIAVLETALALSDLTASPDGTQIAAIDSDGKAKLWRINVEAAAIETMQAHVGGINDASAVGFTDKPAPMLVVGSRAGSAAMINRADNKTIRKVKHGSAVAAVSISVDQTRLVTGGQDGKIRIWNLADGKEAWTTEGDPVGRLKMAEAKRDAARQKAVVDALNKLTTELDKSLTKETEVLKKAAEEQKKANDALAAEKKKLADALAVVSGSEAKIAKAATDTTQATAEIKTVTAKLASAKTSADQLAKELEEQAKALAVVQQAATKAQTQIDAFTKQFEEAKANAENLQKVIDKKKAAMKKAGDDAKAAQLAIDAANKLVASAKAVSEKSSKELVAQKKAATDAEAAQKKAETEVVKRNQVHEAAANAKKRAEAAIPAHTSEIETESRRLARLDQKLTKQVPAPAVVDMKTDAQSITSVHADGTIRRYRLSDGLPIQTFRSTAGQLPSSLCLSGKLICGSGVSQPAQLWSTQETWSLERTIGSLEDPSILSDRVTAIDFRRDGLTIAVGSGAPSRSGEVKVFAVDSGQLARDFGPVHSDTVLGLDFSPDGQTIASAAADKTIRLLNVASGKPIRSLEGHTHHVLSLAWQDDGKTVASASADQSVKVWNTETGEQHRTISGFSKETTAIAFVQTSKQIVTACADGNLRLSDISNGKTIRNMNSAGDFLFSVAVSPDGKKMLAGGQSGTLKIWTLADGKLVHESK
ncbi:MAG: c-type cytochrome domain-containing protein [Rubripirellula sp.]